MSRSVEEYEISLTDSAAKRIVEIVGKESKAGKKLRVAVSGGGCFGFQYGFSLDDTENEDDLFLVKAGATMVIDEMSAAYLQGSEIDWVEKFEGSMFEIKNPNATAACGCGSSFSVG